MGARGETLRAASLKLINATDYFAERYEATSLTFSRWLELSKRLSNEYFACRSRAEHLWRACKSFRDKGCARTAFQTSDEKVLRGRKGRTSLDGARTVISARSGSGNRFAKSRCFRKEFRRVIFALATRTPSALVGLLIGCAVLSAFPAVGIIGRTSVGIVEARSIGCVLIGPAVGFILGMINNSLRPNLFNGCEAEPAAFAVPMFSSPTPWLSNDFGGGQRRVDL